MIRVLFFGHLAEITGTEQTEMPWVTDTDRLVQHIKSDFPQMKDAYFYMAVNHQLVKENQPLKENDTIAFMPPYSGG
jgi:molybdopterin synthase sulfur carrier subunit